MCFVYGSQNRLVFVTEMENVYCAIRAEFLYNTDRFRPIRVKGSKILALYSSVSQPL